MFKKFNPIWIPFLTFWIPSMIAKMDIGNETVKMVLIWSIIIVQVYFLYQGINYIKIKNQAGGDNAGSKKRRDTLKTKK